MEDELTTFVLNPDIPDTDQNHIRVWSETHPDEPRKEDEVIHHINGRRFDNRPENLEKLTHQNHWIKHEDMKKEKIEKTNELINEQVNYGHNGDREQHPDTD